MFYKKAVLKNFAKFTGKHLYQSLFFNKVAGLRTPFFIERLWWLLFSNQKLQFLTTVKWYLLEKWNIQKMFLYIFAYRFHEDSSVEKQI